MEKDSEIGTPPPPTRTHSSFVKPPKTRAPTGPLCSETRAREAQTATRSLDDPLLPADPVKARGGPRRKPETGTLDAPSLQGRTIIPNNQPFLGTYVKSCFIKPQSISTREQFLTVNLSKRVALKGLVTATGSSGTPFAVRSSLDSGSEEGFWGLITQRVWGLYRVFHRFRDGSTTVYQLP